MKASQQQAARLKMMEMEAQALALPASKEELEADYRLWLCNLLPAHFRSTPDKQFSPHQRDFWGWGWKQTPDPGSALLIWNRGGAKSTSVQGLAVARGARGWSKYVLIVCRTQPQADSHIASINSMLLSSNVPGYYPAMSEPELKHVGSRTQKSAWNHEMLTTAEGWTVRGFGLLGAGRGIKVEEYRPDLIIVSDIDKVLDSPGMVKSLLSALSADVLGTMANDCMVIFDQNLIHRGSVLNKIVTRETDVLSERRVFGPVPAVRDNPKYKRVSERWTIVQGEPTWPAGMPLSECEAKLNKVGMDSWEREYQHNITLAYPDAVYPSWDEVYHVITESEFAGYLERYGISCHETRNPGETGNFRLPERGKIVQAQDWGNNPVHPCANRWAWRPAEGMPAEILRDVFFYREMCWPRFPLVEDDDRRNPSAMTVGAAIQDVEGTWESKRVLWRLASHERPEIIRGYLVDLPLTGRPKLVFHSVNTDRARGGILHMQNFLAIDFTKKHPFRSYPVGHPEAGKPLMGKPRVFFVVADGQGELYWDRDTGQLAVRPAIDEAGQARTRFEYPNFRKPDTAQGAERKDPPKIDDDVIDCDRAIAGDLFPTIQAMTKEEQIEAEIPDYLKREVIAALPRGEDRSIAEQGRYQQEVLARRRVERKLQQSSGLSVYEKARLYNK